MEQQEVKGQSDSFILWLVLSKGDQEELDEILLCSPVKTQILLLVYMVYVYIVSKTVELKKDDLPKFTTVEGGGITTGILTRGDNFDT